MTGVAVARNHRSGIDGQAHAEPKEQFEVRVAQMLDRVIEVATGQVLESQVEVMMGPLDCDSHRLEIAEVDRTRDQHLVAHQRHFAA